MGQEDEPLWGWKVDVTDGAIDTKFQRQIVPEILLRKVFFSDESSCIIFLEIIVKILADRYIEYINLLTKYCHVNKDIAFG